MNEEKDDIIDKIAELNTALNAVQLEYPEYFPGKGEIIKPADKLRNHFYVKYDNEKNRIVYIILKNDYPDLIKSCLDCFDQHI